RAPVPQFNLIERRWARSSSGGLRRQAPAAGLARCGEPDTGEHEVGTVSGVAFHLIRVFLTLCGVVVAMPSHKGGGALILPAIGIAHDNADEAGSLHCALGGDIPQRFRRTRFDM